MPSGTVVVNMFNRFDKVSSYTVLINSLIGSLALHIPYFGIY